jgi:predicted nucleotidyltransferase
MLQSNENINIIKLIAHQYLPEAQVLLFGSRARNESRIDSDYDILLIINQTLAPKEKIPFISKIRKSLLHYEILSDVIIQSKGEIEKN